jgi:hypothetical protein
MRRSGLATIIMLGLVLTGCQGADGDPVAPVPTARPTGTATSTPSSSPSSGSVSGTDPADGIAPMPEPAVDDLFDDAIDVAPDAYLTVIGTTPDDPSPQTVGREGDHSQIEGVEFRTPDDRTACAIFSPYYPDGESPGLIVLCSHLDPPPGAACQAMTMSPFAVIVMPPVAFCGESEFSTEPPVLAAGSALSWGAARCAVIGGSSVLCRAAEYSFLGTATEFVRLR